jgi:alpha-N-arabinofuranosidase
VKPEVCSAPVNPSFLAYRQKHLNGYASTALDFLAQHENEKAGIIIFQNEFHFYFLCKSVREAKPVVQLFKSGLKSKCPMELLAEADLTSDAKLVQLKIEARGEAYAFFYLLESEWILLAEGIDAKFLSTREAGGFVGCVYALYATSLNEESSNIANFDWFEYKGDDDTY